MCDDTTQTNLKTLREQLLAWQRQISLLGFDDRTRFIKWLSEVLTLYEFALIIDGEILRSALWEIYLRERSGP